MFGTTVGDITLVRAMVPTTIIILKEDKITWAAKAGGVCHDLCFSVIASSPVLMTF